MENPKFSILLYAIQTNTLYYRELMESITKQEYTNYELIVLDDNPSSELQTITEEFFPGDDRVIYRKLKNHNGRAYALNIGLHFATGDYYVILGQDDTISPLALSSLSQAIEEKEPALIYADHDELIDESRMNPHFKPDFNKQLFLQQDYIGTFICFARTNIASCGKFNEKRQYADIYEYVLHCMEAGVLIHHIPSLLYHKRIIEFPASPAYRERREAIYDSYKRVVREYLKRAGLEAELLADPLCRYWKLKFDGSGYKAKKREYIVLRDKGVRVHNSKKAMERMYAELRQPDVAVVGCKFLGSGLNIDNCGYIYDKDGITYPACYGQKTYHEGYDYRIELSRDVSMVDFSFCLLDENVFRHLHGFNSALTGRDMILDYCMRVRRAGYRVVYEPTVVAKLKNRESLSSEISNTRLLELWEDEIKMGDPFYNVNLPVGLDNYQL